ncbi:MAG: hypothetical protein CMQ29_13760 [Gammaproteobacteria bacterium]|nr:hypothetical protein [Gammaproteobacteria bacterium]
MAFCEQDEQARDGRYWSTAELTLGFMRDLAKLIQAHLGVLGIERHEAKFGHGLADCLWSVLVMAERCGLDSESALERKIT